LLDKARGVKGFLTLDLIRGKVQYNALEYQQEASQKPHLALEYPQETSQNPYPALEHKPETFQPNEALLQLSAIRKTIEYIPVLKYLGKEIIYPVVENFIPSSVQNITVPSIFENKPMLFSAHALTGILGVLQLPKESQFNGMKITLIGSYEYGMRLILSSYLSEVRSEIKNLDHPLSNLDMAKYGAKIVGAYLSLQYMSYKIISKINADSAYQASNLFLPVTLGMIECGNIYKSQNVTTEHKTSLTHTILPYIADGAVLAISLYGFNFGSTLLSGNMLSNMGNLEGLYKTISGFNFAAANFGATNIASNVLKTLPIINNLVLTHSISNSVLEIADPVLNNMEDFVSNSFRFFVGLLEHEADRPEL
jgi:hypothetical protein